MDIWHKVLVGVGIALLVFAGILFYGWIGSHDATIRMQATLDAQQAVIAKSNEQTKQLQDADKERSTQEAATLDAMQRLVASVKTPQQIAQWLPQNVPTPQPFVINVPQPTAANPKPDATATIPQDDLPALRDYTEKCNECSVKLSASEADVTSREEQLRIAGEKLSATERERDAAITAAKGGTWFQRFKKATKYILIGAGIGAVAVCGSGHCK